MARNAFDMILRGTRRHLENDGFRSFCHFLRLRRSGMLEWSRRSFSKVDPNVIRSCYPEVEIPELPVHEFVFRNLAGRENKIAIECGQTKKKWTFRDLFRKSKAVACWLLDQLKLQKGDHIAIILPNCPEYPVALLACSMSGVVPTTVNPSYTSGEVSIQLRDTSAKLIWTVVEAYGKCVEAMDLLNEKIPVVIVKNGPDCSIPTGAIDFEEIASSRPFGIAKPENFGFNDVFVLPYSSGTSGLPKGVQLTHKNIISNLVQYQSITDLKCKPDQGTNQCSILGVLPMFHIYGMVVITLDSISEGAKLISLPGFEPNLFVETIYTKKVQILYLVPPLVFFLNSQPTVESKHLENVQSIISGAAPCGETDVLKLKEKANHLNVCQGYGMTETSPVITMSHKSRYHKVSSVGHPVPSTLIKVADVTSGQALPQGEIGEICMKGPQVMKGYLNRPEENKNILDNEGWLRTGDIGYYDDEKDFYIVDRIKELIKVKGFQVAPAELEEFLRNHPKLSDAGVVGVEHPQYGEVPKAFVVVKQGVSCSEKEITDYVKENLSSHKQLKGGVQFLKAIPKSNAGKILRKHLKKLHEERNL